MIVHPVERSYSLRFNDLITYNVIHSRRQSSVSIELDLIFSWVLFTFLGSCTFSETQLLLMLMSPVSISGEHTKVKVTPQREGREGGGVDSKPTDGNQNYNDASD